MNRPRLRCWWDRVHVADFVRVASNGMTLRCEYTPEALDRWAVRTPLLSCSLPVQSKPVDASNFLRGLLPEGQHLQALAQLAGVSTTDMFSMLARYGRDSAGALIITATDDPPEPGPGRVEPYDDAAFTGEIAGLEDNLLGVHDDSELSIAGLQNKLLLVRLGDGRWGRPVHGYPSTHILKVDDVRYPGLIRAEAAALTLAHRVGLTGHAPEVVRAADRDCLIVTRYDRELRDGEVGRVHQEDACQALDVDINAWRGRGKYERHGGPSLAAIATELNAHALDRTHELGLLVRQTTYTTVIGNGDWHGKNISLLHDVNGHIRVAPVYDTVPTRLFPALRSPGAVRVAGEFDLDRITLERIVDEARSWGLSRLVAEAAAVETAEELLAAADSVGHDGLRDLVAVRAQRLLDGRA